MCIHTCIWIAVIIQYENNLWYIYFQYWHWVYFHEFRCSLLHSPLFPYCSIQTLEFCKCQEIFAEWTVQFIKRSHRLIHPKSDPGWQFPSFYQWRVNVQMMPYVQLKFLLHLGNWQKIHFSTLNLYAFHKIVSILGANPEVIPGPTGSTQCIFKNIWIWCYPPLMWQFLLQVEVNLRKKDELSIAGQETKLQNNKYVWSSVLYNILVGFKKWTVDSVTIF